MPWAEEVVVGVGNSPPVLTKVPSSHQEKESLTHGHFQGFSFNTDFTSKPQEPGPFYFFISRRLSFSFSFSVKDF